MFVNVQGRDNIAKLDIDKPFRTIVICDSEKT